MLSRRSFMKASIVAGGLLTLPTWMPRLAFAQENNPRGDVLISIFLRGGADALNMIVPHGEDAYYTARPQLAIARPDDRAEGKALDLDGFFGLHPALAPLLPIFNAGQMQAIHATGAPHNNLSHFEAMDFMERGEMGAYNLTSGWIGRHLQSLSSDNPSPVRGIGWGSALPAALSGSGSTLALQSIIDYHLNGDELLAQKMMQSLNQLYSLESESLHSVANSTQAAISLIQSVGYANYQPQNRAVYPDDDFANALRQTAALIRAQVGLEVACIDLGGWDTHANQGAANGSQAALMRRLSEGLAAFHQDMGTELSRISVVVMSEFGRRLEENSSQGTDHGHGGAMLVMSGNLAQPMPVFSRWPSLNEDALVDGDLAITTDYRDVLGELLRKRLKNEALADIFPEYSPSEQGLFT